MDKVTQQNAANAEESASSAEEMTSQAEQLGEMVEDLVALVGGNRHKPVDAAAASPAADGTDSRIAHPSRPAQPTPEQTNL
jgi:methyl-accepting chemotaxis protein